MSTLAERITLRLQKQPGTNKAGLAVAAGVSKPAVSKWLAGTTKEILASNVFGAARYLGCRPEWLADGTGTEEHDAPYPTTTPSAHHAAEPTSPYGPPVATWPFMHITPDDWQRLDEREKGRAEQLVLNVINDNRQQPKKTPASA